MKKKYYWIIGIVIVITLILLISILPLVNGYCLFELQCKIIYGYSYYCMSSICQYGGGTVIGPAIGPLPGSVSLESARNQGCQDFIKTNCNASIMASVLIKNFDADRNEKLNDSRDNVWELCRNYYYCPDETCCKRLCGCSGY